MNDCRKFDLMVTSLENDGYAVKARCKNASLDEEWNVELKDIWADTKIAVGSSIRLIEPKLIAEKVNTWFIRLSPLLSASEDFIAPILLKGYIVHLP